MSYPLYLAIFMQLILVLILFNFLPISGAKQFEDPPIIQTSHGKVRGKNHMSQNGKLYAQFLGLPYARPPVGELRFKRPQPSIASWKNIRDATKPPPICSQLNLNHTGTTGQEDCLVVNVYQPATCAPLSPCAVMVWIHPGEFAFMDGSPKTFGPQLWMDHGIVMVSLNYRLGVLGFLSLENEAAPGNLGLRDQALALKWIKQEISAFGGDPDRITLIGAGAGGSSAILHMLSPQNVNQSLFHGVISQSGSPIEDKQLEFARSKRAYALEVAGSLGCSKTKMEHVLKCLQSVEADAIQKKLTMFSENDFLFLPNPFVPSLDPMVSDPLLPQKPEQILQSGHYEKVPIIMGGNSHEGIALMGQFLAHPGMYANFTESLPLLMLNRASQETTEGDTDLVEVVKRAYLDTKKIFRLNMQHGIQLFTDFSFLGQIGRTTQLLQSVPNGPPVFQYIFRYSGTHSFGDISVYAPWKLKFKLFLHSFGIGYNMRNGYGVCHGDELFLMFKLGNLLAPMGLGPTSERDKRVSGNILRTWTNFAKTGTPSRPSDIFQWTPTQAPAMRFATIGSDMIMSDVPAYWERVEFFHRITSQVGLKPEGLDLTWLKSLGKGSNRSHSQAGTQKDDL